MYLPYVVVALSALAAPLRDTRSSSHPAAKLTAACGATFVDGVKVGGTGTHPFGHDTPLIPAGSCPAHPTGPIADGTHLADQASAWNTSSHASATISAAPTFASSSAPTSVAPSDAAPAYSASAEMAAASLAQCVGGKGCTAICVAALICAALALVKKAARTRFVCTAQADASDTTDD